MGGIGKAQVMKFMPPVQKFQRRNLRSGVNDMTLRATCFHEKMVYIICIYSNSFIIHIISFVSYDSFVILTEAPSPSTALILNQTTVRLSLAEEEGIRKRPMCCYDML